jgi:hypothetical protein
VARNAPSRAKKIVVKYKEKKMTNKKIWTGMLVMILVFGFSFASCGSMGRYDNNSPPENDFTLKGGYVGEYMSSSTRYLTKIVSFDGKKVNWTPDAITNIFQIKIPAGEHTLVGKLTPIAGAVMQGMLSGQGEQASEGEYTATFNFIAGRTYFVYINIVDNIVGGYVRTEARHIRIAELGQLYSSYTEFVDDIRGQIVRTFTELPLVVTYYDRYHIQVDYLNFNKVAQDDHRNYSFSGSKENGKLLLKIDDEIYSISYSASISQDILIKLKNCKSLSVQISTSQDVIDRNHVIAMQSLID